MEFPMTRLSTSFRAVARAGAAALLLVALFGCGGGNDGGAPASSTAPAGPPPSGQVGAALTGAAAVPANDTSSNSSSAFTVLQGIGVPAATVTGAPVVNFTVFSDGKVKQGLTLSNVSFAIAKLVPGINGEIDQWQNYVFRTETTTGANNVGSGAGGTPVLASAKQATTDPKPASQANQLVYHAEGYYTYTFSTNVTDPTKTGGVVFEPNRTHRIAIQLSYTNDAGQTVLVNPYVDVTFDAGGNSVVVTDPSKTRVMADVASCNACHDRLALHGGGRVDVQFCVMCHNPGTTDANSGNVLTMQTMVHKIHSGKLLASSANASKGGEHYTIWGFQSSKHDYAEVGFPQDLRNCTVCHSGANPKTPQGDNWKSRAAKESCLTCHVSGTGSAFDTTHTGFALSIVGPTGKPKDIPNKDCADCHGVGKSVSPERVHFNQNEDNAAKYKLTIESATFDPATRKVTVVYYLANPTANNARYNLITPDCTYPAPTVCQPPSGTNNTLFGNLRLYLAYQNLPGQPAAVTEWTAYNNGGNAANVYMYRGTNDGGNKYTVDIAVPPDSETAVAQGTARVVGIGQVKEQKLEVKSALDPRPVASPVSYVSVVVQHTYADLALSGPIVPRRQIVANEKCNVCHGALGTTSGSNTLANAFHGGARNTVEACVICHDPNKVSSGTAMTSGMALGENYSMKRMIHGIHGTSKRTYPFTQGNNVIGAFNKSTGLLLADGFVAGFSNPPLGTTLVPWATPTVVPAGSPFAADVESYAAEVAYPDLGLDCNLCHVNNSWQQDRSVIGTVVAKPVLANTTTVDANPLNWMVITPKAASCTACHDSATAISHVVGTGGAAFGTATQAQSFQTQESCVDCHGPGKPLGVEAVHK